VKIDIIIVIVQTRRGPVIKTRCGNARVYYTRKVRYNEEVKKHTHTSSRERVAVEKNVYNITGVYPKPYLNVCV